MTEKKKIVILAIVVVMLLVAILFLLLGGGEEEVATPSTTGAPHTETQLQQESTPVSELPEEPVPEATPGVVELPFIPVN